MSAKTTPPLSENSYDFPAYNNSSVRFIIKGAKIKKAVLIVGDFTLGTIRPEYSDDWTPETITKLDFFGDVPFRSALTGNLNPRVQVTTTGVPTLLMEVINDNINWNTVSDRYIEPVTVSTASGEKKLKIVYMQHQCGFIAV